MITSLQKNQYLLKSKCFACRSVHHCLNPSISYKLAVDHSQTRGPFDFYKRKEVLSNEEKDE